MILRLAILIIICLAVCRAEETIFIDDAKIEQVFVERLSAQLKKEKTLTMSEAEAAIEKKRFGKVSIPKITQKTHRAPRFTENALRLSSSSARSTNAINARTCTSAHRPVVGSHIPKVSSSPAPTFLQIAKTIMVQSA